MNDYYAANYYNEGTLTLELLRSTFDHVNKNWQGRVIRSQYSRLYFIKKGSFYIINNDGEQIDFYEEGAHLIPSGYSYIYGCEDENEIFSFHIRLFGFDNIDLLGRFKNPVSCKMHMDFERLSKAVAIRGITEQLAIKSEIYRVLSEISLNSNGLLDTPLYSSDISEAIDYISSHLSVQLSISEIANAVKLANSTLSAKFKREVGMSVGEYIDYRVILTATQMLLSERSSILEISDALGFCDQFYFSRRFKQRYGISPQKFKKHKHL